MWLVNGVLPIAICVVLPIMIVWIVYRAKTNKDNKTAEIVIKAIENNSNIDTDKLVEALGTREKTQDQIMRSILLYGFRFTFTGIASALTALIFFFFSTAEDDIWLIFTIISLFTLAIGAAYLVVYFITRKNSQIKE